MRERRWELDSTAWATACGVPLNTGGRSAVSRHLRIRPADKASRRTIGDVATPFPTHTEGRRTKRPRKRRQICTEKAGFTRSSVAFTAGAVIKADPTTSRKPHKSSSLAFGKLVLFAEEVIHGFLPLDHGRHIGIGCRLGVPRRQKSQSKPILHTAFIWERSEYAPENIPG